MLLTQIPEYATAKNSVYYWERLGRTDKVAVERLAHWKGILEEFRTMKRTGDELTPPTKQMQKVKKLKEKREAIKKQREIWVPPPLIWS
jgi:hypothetical protein